MKVQFAKLSDHDEILQLTRRKEMKHVRDFSNKFLSGPEAYKLSRVLIVKQYRRIVGFVLLNHRLSRKDYTNILFIGTAPEVRGAGVAKALVSKALELSPWGRLHAHVAVSNGEAICWYRRTGWTQIGVGKWRTKGDYVIMEKTT